MQKRSFLAIALVALTMCLLNVSAWAVPGLINYQGKLSNSTGVALSGIYTVRFYLYDAEVDGDAIWGETQDVTVTDGTFNVQLGAISSLSANLFDNDELYMEMEIYNPDRGVYETLSPRQRLISTGYAMKAETSDYATLAGSVEDGSISTTKVTNGAITGEKIADGAIGSTKIQDGTIQQTDLAFSVPDGHSLDAADGDPVDAVYVDNEGWVGIGTTEPVSRLNVDGDIRVGLVTEDNGSTEGYGSRLYFSGGDDWSEYDSENSDTLWIARYNLDSDHSELRINIGDNAIGIREDKLLIGAKDYTTGNWYPRMAVVGTGNVGIGTSSPSHKLHVIGDIAYTGNLYDVSDLRLKENITPLTNAIEKVSALRGIYFNLKGEAKREVGVIAQEVEEVLPEVVSEDAEGYKSVDYSKLTPLLIEAVKAQQAQIESMKAENSKLRAELKWQTDELRARIEALESR